MPDWERLRRALAAADPRAEVLRRIRTIEAWLALPYDEALAALREETAGASEPQVRPLYQTFSLQRLKLQRDCGVPAGPDAPAKLQELFAKVAQGRGSERDCGCCGQLAASYQLSAVLLQAHPALGQPVSPAELAQMELRNALTAIFERLSAAAQNCAPGRVTAESVHELEQIGEAYRALVANTGSDNPALPEAFNAMGHAALLLAKSCALIGRNEDAAARFEAAARCFEQAGDPEEATQCRARANELTLSLAADFDKSAARHLESLVTSEPARDLLARAKALVGLADVAANAGDVFEAAQNANAAAKELHRLGFEDPLQIGVDGAVDSWITTAAAGATGIPVLRRVSEVGTWYLSIFGARLAAALREKPSDANRIEALLHGVADALLQAQRQWDAAHAELDREWAIYAPTSPGSSPASPSAPAAPPAATAPETPAAVSDPPGVPAIAAAPADDGYATLVERMRAVDRALLELRQECNNRAAGEPKDDLLAAAERLQREVASLHLPVYDAKTRLERVYILLSLGRAEESLPLAQEARVLLLAGRPPGLASFSQGHERAYYLESLSRQEMAQIMMHDFAAAWKTCEETIKDFETERYRVNSPFRQSAVLGSVADFYKHGAFAAYKLQHWDDMLEAIELIKARSAIRSRLIPDPPELSRSDLAREFERTSAELRRRQPDGDADLAELADRRRRLWDMLAIARASAAGGIQDLPQLSLQGVQATLAEDEALIGYFWLSARTLLVMCVDRDRFVAERVTLEPSERELLEAFTSFVQVLKVAQLSMGATVAKLGAILLPRFCRDFLAQKQRLVLSPHHALHLFPFHASRWDDEYVGTRFAVRYVPNFSSLLLPWESRCENRVLAVAIKEFSAPDVPPLARVEDDALAIERCYTAQGIPVEVITGRDATRERVEQLQAQDRLSGFHCIHFGTHGLSVFETPDQPMESKLLLHDASLDAMDVANLHLGAELAVLSACHSGQRAIAGRDLGEVPGDDIFGLQSAFFQSGVRSVLGALWHVETESSSVLMRAFHRHYAAGRPAETALQLAIKEYLRDPPLRQQEIYYWAPYFISSLGRVARAGEHLEMGDH
jgi:CHAT domain-containing protein